MDTNSIVLIITAVFASTGFWAFISARFSAKDNKREKEDKQMELQSKMLKGLAHDRICYLGEEYVKRGFITKDEYENLHDYLYMPYKELGGNGTAEKIMNEVEKLPIHDKAGDRK